MKYFLFSGLLNFLLLTCIESKASDDDFLKKQLQNKSSIIKLVPKTYKLKSKLIFPPGKIINGNGSKLVFSTIAVNEWQVTLNKNSELSNIEISSSIEPHLFDFQIEGSPLYEKFNFPYVKGFMALWLEGDNIKLNNVKILDSHTGISGNSDNITLNNVFAKGAHAPVLFYTSSHIKIINSTFYGGDFACIGMPSCHDIYVEKCKLYNPKSTGVNPGGAELESMTPKKIVIKNNYIIAGDCINLENGAIDAIITNNTVICAPLINKSINNSAIGLLVHDPKANSIVRNITVSNNSISSYEKLLYGIGVYVGNTMGNSISNITISNNKISGGNEGIRIENKKTFFADRINIYQNTISSYAFGIRLLNVKNGQVNNNTAKTFYSSWNENLWGFMLHNCSNLTIMDNSTSGFTKHYYQADKCNQVKILRPTILKGESKGEYHKFYIEKHILGNEKMIYN